MRALYSFWIGVAIHCAKQSRRHAGGWGKEETRARRCLEKQYIVAPPGKHRSDMTSSRSRSGNTRVDRHIKSVNVFNDNLVVNLQPFHALESRATRRRAFSVPGGGGHMSERAQAARSPSIDASWRSYRCTKTVMGGINASGGVQAQDKQSTKQTSLNRRPLTLPPGMRYII